MSASDKKEHLNIVLSGGGTTGHINPALAVGESLVSDGHSVFFAGTPDRIESEIVPREGIPYKAFEVHGFRRSHPLTLVTGIASILKATSEAKTWLKEIGADAVVGFGGYVCLPVSRAAKALGIPVIVCEQNSVMGMSNKYIGKFADAICLTYKNTLGTDSLPKEKTYVTGNPVRKAVCEKTRKEGRAYLGVPDDAKVLLVTGGSLGARSINNAMAAGKEKLLDIEGLHIVHITGKDEYDSVCEALSLRDEEKDRYDVRPYESDMSSCLAAADLVVSRAGASTLSEIEAIGVPAILVPYPLAAENHQMRNAEDIVEAGGAVLIDDSDLDSGVLIDTVMELLNDKSQLDRMRTAMSSRCGKNNEPSADVVAEIVEEAVPHR